MLQVTDDDLDKRMSAETKQFVINYLKAIKPSDTPKLDVKLTRQFRARTVAQLNELVDFVGLRTSELSVISPLDGYEIPVTLYQPAELKPTSPITIFFHGGGWTFGSRQTHHFAVAANCLETKSIWLSVEYRLAPEFKFKTIYNDCKAVLEWVAKNKGNIGDGKSDSKLGVAGDSSGGHIAALLAHEYSNLIDFQLLVYPCVDLSKEYDSNKEYSRDCFILVPEVIKWFANNMIDDGDDVTAFTRPYYSPLLNADFTRLPKCLIIVAELDPLIDQCKAYYEKLKAAGVECQLEQINGTIHGYFSQGILVPEAFSATKAFISDFFNKI